MLKKISLSTILAIGFYVCMSGQNSVYFDYYATVNQAELSHIDGDFLKADSLYAAAFMKVDRPFSQDYFLAAVNARKINDLNKIQNYLERSFATGVLWKQLKEDSVYQFVKKNKLTKALKKTYKTVHYNYIQSLDTELRKKMFEIVEKDQKYREWRYVKKGWKEQKPILQKTGEEHFAELVEICETKGFPGFRLIGENLTSKYDEADISLLMRHFTEERLEQLKPYILDAIANGDIYPWHYATAYDYTSMFKTTVDDRNEDGKPILIIQQVYGTMSYRNDNGEWTIYNVENLENSDSIRLKIGLEPIKDYAKKREWKMPSEGFYEKVFDN